VVVPHLLCTMLSGARQQPRLQGAGGMELVIYFWFLLNAALNRHVLSIVLGCRLEKLSIM
jgi:hypothetical protein